MARTTIATSLQAARTGVELATAAAVAELQWQFDNTEKEYLVVKNGDVAPKTVTIDIPKLVDGKAIADLTVTVDAGKTMIIGPFPAALYNQANGKVNVDLSGATSVELAVLKDGNTTY